MNEWGVSKICKNVKIITCKLSALAILAIPSTVANGMSMLIYRRECCKYGAAVVKKGICNGETYFTKNVYEMCVNNANLISGKRFGIFWFWFIRIFYTVYMLMFDTYRY